jgi:hypothetical protein
MIARVALLLAGTSDNYLALNFLINKNYYDA